MSEGFVHSVKVPRLYKTVAKIVQNVQENGASLKQLIYQQKHTNVQGVYALAFNTVRHGDQLNQLIRKTQILFKEQRLDPWLTRVLITELIWGKQCLKSESKPIQTVLSYEKELREEMKNITEDVDSPTKVGKPRYVRVNTLAMSVDDAIANFQEEGWNFQSGFDNYSSYLKIVSNLNGESFVQDFHIPELLVFPQGTAFFNHPGYKSGSIILQDKASCFPAFLLNPPIGSTVLDMCSAPGMKSTHLAAILKNKGKIFSVEMDERRFKTLCDVIESTNSTCVETINKDALTVDSTQCPNIEYILVDPSCSGSGMVDREKVNGKIEKCAPGRLRSLQSFQVLLLRHALLNFPSAKKVVYSTCSIEPEENEHVIDEILADLGEAYKLVPTKDLLDGNWLNFSSLDFNCKDNCLYARPEVDLTNGFFVAVFERNFDVPLPEYKRKAKTGNSIAKQNGHSEENQENEENKIENTENSGETKEWKLTASQRKRMRRRKKLNQQTSENSKEDAPENKKSNSSSELDPSKLNPELTESNSIVDSVEKSKQRKKKKKKKKNQDSIKIQDSIQEIEIPEKKKFKSDISTEIEQENSLPKKKKQKLEENSLSTKTEKSEPKEKTPKEKMLSNETGESDEKSKKRKKSKLVEEHLPDNQVLSQGEVSEKKKRKKRKHNEATDISVNVDVNIESENPSKKAKKKKHTENC